MNKEELYGKELDFIECKGCGWDIGFCVCEEESIKKYSLYKNGIHLHDFATIKECSAWLENLIGGSLYQGLCGLKDGWKPKEHSQLFGYEVKIN
ncbi:hypothetical protein [Bacillus sp. AFS031507]|uniref:hypothetical protein n=1 Tax=Bacillus sp. AFS031507 TaxID=2033496 RepID=UPI000BFE50AC|nr:hypothetical protein [Bacillus sp. AFS031507]PGY13197.1 hypothetical protein COE25_08555 [Bacillus sp. AFS031507]